MRNIKAMFWITALFVAIPATAQDGKALYGIKCAPCHGLDGSAYNVVGHLVTAQNFRHDLAGLSA